MRRISHDPADLVAQTLTREHQYPDGMIPFLSALSAPRRIGTLLDAVSPTRSVTWSPPARPSSEP